MTQLYFQSQNDEEMRKVTYDIYVKEHKLVNTN